MTSGVVYSKGLEIYAARAQQAIAASRPLLASLHHLTKASEELSKASAEAVKLPDGQLQKSSRGLKEVASASGKAASGFGHFVSGAGSVLLKASLLITVLHYLSNAKAKLAGKSKESATILGQSAHAMGIVGDKFRSVGGMASLAGLGIGVLTGAVGPMNAVMSLLGIGLMTTPGPMGAVTIATGGMTAAFGLASVAAAVLAAVVAAVVAALALLGPGLLFGVKLAAQAEQSQIAFEVMLGSGQKATQLLGQIRAKADATPWGSAELTGAARSLLAFGEAADNIVPALGRIGDVSSGIGAPIGDIAELYGKARVQGRLFAMDINQLTNRGIPIIQELGKQFGVLDSEVKALVESGAVQFSHLEQAFISLTGEGGRFHDMTAKQSQSLLGMWSTFKDAVSTAFRKLGEELIKTGSLQRIMVAGGTILKEITPLFGLLAQGIVLSLGPLTQLVEYLAVGVQKLREWAEYAGIIQETTVDMGALAAAAALVTPVQLTALEDETRLKAVVDLLDRYRSKAESLRLEWAEIDRTIENLEQRKELKLLAMNASTGVLDLIKEATREIEIMEKKATKTQHVLDDLFAGGASMAQVNQLEQLTQKLDALKAQAKVKDEQRKTEEDATKKARQFADQWAEKMADPIDKLKSGLADIQSNEFMSVELKNKATDSLGREYLKEEQARNPAAAAPQKNDALVSGTQAALSSIIAATTARRPQQRTEDLLTALNKTATETKNGIDILARNAVTSAVAAQRVGRF